jgi:hypothetical protein
MIIEHEHDARWSDKQTKFKQILDMNQSGRLTQWYAKAVYWDSKLLEK